MRSKEKREVTNEFVAYVLVEAFGLQPLHNLIQTPFCRVCFL